jgi:predicted enzyme related to lactoylglutathione lyase
MHGRFRWYELYANNPATAKKFYPPITGWGIENWADAGDEPYEMWTAGGVPFAGLMAVSPEMKSRGAPPHWVPYIGVKSASETLAKAASLGGQTAWGPETVPTVGTFAGIKDPQGAIFAILQPAQESPGYEGNATLGKPSWHELMTSDYKAAYAFYSALFGWDKHSESDVGNNVTYLEFGTSTGKKSVGGMFNRFAPTIHPHWLIYTNVRDVKAAKAVIERGGGKVINGPMEVPGGTWIVAFTDPEGVAHALHSVPAKAPSKPAKKAKKAAKKSKPEKSKKEKKKEKKKAKKKAKKAAKRAKKAAKKAKKKKR